MYLPFRHQGIEIAISLYKHCISPGTKARVLDLGCGDGLFIQELMKSQSPVSVILVDGSAEMIDAAIIRLKNNADLTFIEATFQDLRAGKSLTGKFDYIYSSLAIHHLPFEEKRHLYTYIHESLSPGGCFVNNDVVATSERIEKWYLSLWTQWIIEHSSEDSRGKLLGIPEQYKSNPDNMPDSLESQIQMLRQIGFIGVDCFFKYGIFSIFGGFK